MHIGAAGIFNVTRVGTVLKRILLTRNSSLIMGRREGVQYPNNNMGHGHE